MNSRRHFQIQDVSLHHRVSLKVSNDARRWTAEVRRRALPYAGQRHAIDYRGRSKESNHERHRDVTNCTWKPHAWRILYETSTSSRRDHPSCIGGNTVENEYHVTNTDIANGRPGLAGARPVHRLPHKRPYDIVNLRSYTLLACIVGLAFVLTSCDTTEPETRRILIPREVQSSQYTTTESGLKYYDFIVGEGAEAGEDSRVTVNFAAWLSDQSLLSNTFDGDNPLTVDLASENIVEGWSEGVPGMRVGGQRQLVVPPSLAYGEDGYPEGGIPANATITYEIELLEVEE